jgi:hypothetical protein
MEIEEPTKMIVRQPRYSMEEFARLGDEIYERNIRPQVEASLKGEIVAIDIETGDWEIGGGEMAASRRLRARRPDAQTWVVRVGYPYVRRFGSRATQVR